MVCLASPSFTGISPWLLCFACLLTSFFFYSFHTIASKMGQVNLAPFLLRYVKLLATALFAILVWTMVNRTISYHASPSVLIDTPPPTKTSELSNIEGNVKQGEIQKKGAEDTLLPDLPPQWTDINSTLGVRYLFRKLRNYNRYTNVYVNQNSLELFLPYLMRNQNAKPDSYGRRT